MDAAPSYSLQQLAEELADLRRQQNQLRMPGLAYSSFPTGYGNSIDQVDEATGATVLQVGSQFDGGSSAMPLVDPPLPTPSAAMVTPVGSSVNVAYDGTFIGGGGETDITIPVPTYWSKTEIHVSTDPNFTAETWDTLKDTFTSPRGGVKTIAVEPGTYYVRLVARGAAGGRSQPSAPVQVIAVGGLTQADLTALEEAFDADMLALSNALAAKPGPLSGAADPAAAPVVRAPKGSTYFRLDGTGGVIGNYEQTEDEGDGTGDTWALRPFRSDVLTSLDVGKLSAATANITTGVADKFFANIFATRRLSAQHIYVGPGSNPIPDPAFLDTTTTNAKKSRSTGGTAAWTDVAGTATSPKGVRRTGLGFFDLWPLPSAAAADIPGMIAVEAGTTWKLSVDVETSSSAAVQWRLRVAFGNNTFATQTATTLSGGTATGRRTLTSEFVVPAGAVAITPQVEMLGSSTFTLYGNPFMGLKTDGSLIVQGSLDAMTITGPLIQTSNLPNTGLKWTDAGLTAYGPTGTPTFLLAAATGDVSIFGGEFSTESTLYGQITIQGSLGLAETWLDPFQQLPALQFFNTAQGVDDFGATVHTRDGLELTLASGRQDALPGNRSYMRIAPTGIFMDSGGQETNIHGTSLAFDADLFISGLADRYTMHTIGQVSNLETIFTQEEGTIKLDSTLITLEADSITALSALLNVSGNVQATQLRTGGLLSPSFLAMNYDVGAGVIRPGIWLSRDGGAGGDEASIVVGPNDNLIIDPPTGKNTLMAGRTRLGYGTTGHMIFAPSFAGMYFRNTTSGSDEGTADAAIWTPANTGILYMRGPQVSGARQIRVDTGTFFEIYDPPVSTFAANMGLSSSPKDRVYRISSSGKRKINQELIPDEKAWQILGIEPTTWFDLAQLEELYPEAAAKIDRTNPIKPTVDPALLGGLIRRHPGLVANQVHAAGLTEFVSYDEFGDPESVDYDRLWTLVIPILRYILEKVGYPSTTKAPIKPSPWKPSVVPAPKNPVVPTTPKTPTSPKSPKGKK